MAGAFDWLDTLSSQIGDVAGRAVDAAGAVASAKIDAEQRRAVIGDQSPVPATSPIQTARPGIVVNPVWVGVGLAAAVGLWLLMRKA